LFRELPTAI